MDFLPKAFGAHYLQGEHLVFSWLRELRNDYQGGYWHYYWLSNGAIYMAPDITSDYAWYGQTISLTVKCRLMRLALSPRSMG